MLIDTDKPLYDSDGYEHHFVAKNGREIVTKRTGIFCIWDARTGDCLRAGVEECRLTNTPLSEEELARRKAEGQRMLAELHEQAQEAQRKPQGASLGM